MYPIHENVKLVALLPYVSDLDSKIEQVARILSQAWPASGDAHKREQQLRNATRKAQGDRLPISFSFESLEDDIWKVYGHVKLQDTADASFGKAVAITSVVIDSRFRGRGYGKDLMRLLEEKARSMGYGMVYLWTDDAADFYAKCGYKQCDRVSLSLPVFKSFGKQAEGVLDTLENALSKKFALLRQGGNNNDAPVQEDSLPPESASSSYLWMRKRLVDFVESQPGKRWETVEKSISHEVKLCTRSSVCWRAFVRNVPWQQQVGPTCGLTAARMVFECLAKSSRVDAEHPYNQLLQEAIKRNYTSEGEMFHIESLQTLINDKLEMVASLNVIESPQACLKRLLDVLHQGGLVIYPYDRQAGSFLPDCVGGTAAHYCIIVGYVGLGTEVTGEKNEVLELPRAESNLEPSLDNVLLVAQHSGRDHYVVATPEQFFASNAQLASAKQQTENQWKTEDMSLRCKYLVLQPTPK